MSFIVVSFSECPQKYIDQWQKLLIDSHLSSAKQWIECIQGALNPALNLKVGFCLKDEQITAVLPFYIHQQKMNKISMRTVELATNLLSYHTDAMGKDWDSLFDYLTNHEWGKWDLFIAGQIPISSRLKQSLLNYSKQKHLTLLTLPSDLSPYIKITQSFSDFLATKKSSFRNNVGRFERRMEKLGVCRQHLFKDPEEMDELLQIILDIERKSWKVEANMAILENSPEAAYYQCLLPWLAKTNQILANVEYIDDKAVAYTLCSDWNKTLAVLKTSFDNDYQRDSVGKVVNSRMIRYAFEQGYQEFDFLGDTMQYKKSWQTDERAHEVIYLYGKTLKGRIMGILKQRIAWWKARQAEKSDKT